MLPFHGHDCQSCVAMSKVLEELLEGRWWPILKVSKMERAHGVGSEFLAYHQVNLYPS